MTMALQPHELKALAIELAAAMPPSAMTSITKTAGQSCTPLAIRDEVDMLLYAIRGVAWCMEGASRCYTDPAVGDVPPDEAIPAAAHAIHELTNLIEAKLGASDED
ncbi:hypothetical protein [Luteimonas sp. R10]|uniref:hypothetical protein n=1 Tax=Luteimonas sp. R10 TaxID=3108176 RepID=UPI00308DE907|nr:hypothetical protein U3649_14490 [Luteimonas sp. R10]